MGLNNSGTIIESYATGNVEAVIYAGGLVGENRGGTIIESHATGDATTTVQSSNARRSGGAEQRQRYDKREPFDGKCRSNRKWLRRRFVGYNKSGSIRACYATGTAEATGAGSVGGLVGWNSSTIRASYATGNAKAKGAGSEIGGLVGNNHQGFISASYATGNAEATGTGGDAGGFVGENEGTISASYSTGDATTADGRAGGFVGWNEGGTIIASFCTGDATATGSGTVGGLVAENDADGTITKSYFDTDLSTATDGVGTGTIITGLGRATTALQEHLTYGGDYADWNIDVDDVDADDDVATGVDDPWDFGSNVQYPALKVDFDGDTDATAYEFGGQERSAPLTITTVNPMFGFVGTMVTIEGQNFDATPANNTVTFLGATEGTDDRVATVTTASTTELVVEVPADAVTGLIEVEVNGSTAVSDANFIVYSPNEGDLSLIDITTLEQLDAIRYDLDGDGVASIGDEAAYLAAFGAPSCTDGCTGYELMESLDFEDADGDGTADDKSIWAEGSTVAGAVPEGWLPIGDNTNLFTAVFEGNDHTISNLYIDRSSTNYVGLVGNLGSGGEVRNLGTVGGSVTGRFATGGLVGQSYYGTISMCYATGNVTGDIAVGGLVGNNSGSITACYASGNVTGNSNIGGLVGSSEESRISMCYATGNAAATGQYGSAGGLAGSSFNGWIEYCYATGTVEGEASVGGLVGYHGTDGYGGTISASYSTGDATTADGNAGGLVGENEAGTIIASFCTGDATTTGSGTVGGLVGENDINGTITTSYFDTDLSTATQGVGTEAITDPPTYAKITTELQGALAYGGIYAAWNIDVDNADMNDDITDGVDDPWDFGTNVQYPALKVDFDGNNDATWEEFGDQERSAPSPPPILPPPPTSGDDAALINITTLEQLDAMRYDLDGDGVASIGDEAAYLAAFGTPSCASSCTGYELMKSLDFEDADGDGTADDKSIWAEGSTVAGAVAEGWLPLADNSTTADLGDNSTAADDSRFMAIFEGNDNTISNLYINRTSTILVGLFGYLGFGGEVRNLGIKGGSVTGVESSVGGLVGYNRSGSISACYATGNAETSGLSDKAGGLVGGTGVRYLRAIPRGMQQ